MASEAFFTLRKRVVRYRKHGERRGVVRRVLIAELRAGTNGTLTWRKKWHFTHA
jgi:hypothetical protein